ncbi:MAG: dicarboxylate/amino acid:cation symporter [Pirellulaceae bacterium]
MNNNQSSQHGLGHQTIYLVVAIVLAILTSVVLVWVLPEPDADGLPVAVKGDESRFTDGHTFTIKDKDGKLYKFEFNRESAKKDYHQIRISNGKRNAQQMAVVIAEAINAVTGDSVKAEAHDERILLAGAAEIKFSVNMTALGVVVHPAVPIFEAIGIGGEVFLRALTMVVVPLVMASVMSGILGLGDVRKLGRPGLVAVSYYLATTVLAVTAGLLVVSLIKPGENASLDETATTMITGEDREQVLETFSDESGLKKEKVAKLFPQLDGETEAVEETGVIGLFGGLILMLFSSNLFASAVETQLLPLIVFSIIFAGMLTTISRRVDTVTTLIEEGNMALMAFVLLLMKLAPLGIFCLIASRFGMAFAEGNLGATLQQTGWYMFCVLLGLGFHSLVTLPLIYWFVTGKNPYQFMHDMSQALLTAFSTASSTATLPVTMECAHTNAGISKKSTNFVLPLGATINMDGTALYEAVAAVFIAQIYQASPAGIEAGFELGLMQMVVIAVTATLAAIGAAGIPEAGLITMLIVLNAVGLPPEYIGSILVVDWLLDRFRTAINTFGDAVGCAVVEKSFPPESLTETTT